MRWRHLAAVSKTGSLLPGVAAEPPVGLKKIHLIPF